MGELEGRLENWKWNPVETRTARAQFESKAQSSWFSKDTALLLGPFKRITDFTALRSIVTPCLEREVQSRGWDGLKKGA